jgi:hypothetical protein
MTRLSVNQRLKPKALVLFREGRNVAEVMKALSQGRYRPSKGALYRWRKEALASSESSVAKDDGPRYELAALEGRIDYLRGEKDGQENTRRLMQTIVALPLKADTKLQVIKELVQEEAK